jgi:hypothetical protein
LDSTANSVHKAPSRHVSIAESNPHAVMNRILKSVPEKLRTLRTPSRPRPLPTACWTGRAGLEGLGSVGCNSYKTSALVCFAARESRRPGATNNPLGMEEAVPRRTDAPLPRLVRRRLRTSADLPGRLQSTSESLSSPPTIKKQGSRRKLSEALLQTVGSKN